MSQRLSDIWKFYLLALVTVTLGGIMPAYGQAVPLVTGQINKYAKVLTVGVDYVTVQNASDFSAGDTVMVIQMSGAEINASTILPGNIQNTVGSPGSFEIMIVQSVVGNQITFTRTILFLYDPVGKVQIIKMGIYLDAVVNAELSCAPWDSTTSTGGVLAFMANRLTLNADINVSGRGFKGGQVALGSATCQETGDAYRYYFYDISSTAAGFKGEGVGFRNEMGISIYPSLARGKGVTLTGGGGGNGHFSGGGGGSNYGAGSPGDIEVAGCGISYNGGLGGYSIGETVLNGGVFMGGGGGASVYSVTPNTASGGRGGGIIVIFAGSIQGNGLIISAKGQEPNANTLANAGAAGGGAGGSVILSAGLILSDFGIQAGGGKGGNTVNSLGAGGGGGGGLIWTQLAFPGTASVAGGLSGLNNGTNPNRDGFTGLALINPNLPLNGFIFNEIFSNITYSTVDSICEGETPPTILGAQPAGGDGSYTYQWQKSYDNLIWSPVPLATGKNLVPSTTEASTVWFRRVVYDGGGIIDYGRPVQIIVHPLITGNLVGSDTTLCYNQNPEELYPLNSGPGGGTGLYFYTWERSDNNALWGSASGTGDQPTYDPPALTLTQYYHRVINSGACTDISPSVTVTILPVINGNTVGTDQTVCQGTAFSNLNPTATLTGGASTYTYRWESSSDNISWAAAAGVNTGSAYDPQDDSPGTYYYQRIVYSGMNNTCQSTSPSLHLLSHPAISGNTVASAQTICEGSSPALLNGSVPSGGAGAGTYTYQWENSTNGVNFNFMTGITAEDFSGAPLTVSTWYRRIAYSSVCSNVSNVIMITVDPALTNYEIGLPALGHDTISTGQAPGLLQGTPGGGLAVITFKWESSTDNSNFTDLSVSTQNYQPPVLTTTTWFRRTVTSGVCAVSSTFKITVLPAIGNNTVTADQRVCNTTTPAQLAGTAPTGGDGRFRYLWEKKEPASSLWVSADGTNNTVNYQPPGLGSTTQFRRNVFSGENNCCTSVSSAVTVTVDIMPLNVTAGPDRTLYPYQFAANLEGSYDGTGTSTWSIVSSIEGDPEFVDNTNPVSVVRKLGFGENIFEFRVKNNVCEAAPDEVILTVPEIKIPEGISPNEDGFNDYFNVEGLEYTYNELVIINTGGAVVYRTKDYKSNDPVNGWRGLDNFGDPLPEGTYYFLLTINGAQDISVPEYEAHLSGFIIIRR
ncbi:MAG TPA: gliding motility-associated C-terminal domain-containing protein [Bacteroidales bacterium]|nr:gliding motility-associated C-terminal domain-containing protein [Bacteroidales bacterium]